MTPFKFSMNKCIFACLCPSYFRHVESVIYVYQETSSALFVITKRWWHLSSITDMVYFTEEGLSLLYLIIHHVCLYILGLSFHVSWKKIDVFFFKLMFCKLLVSYVDSVVCEAKFDIYQLSTGWVLVGSTRTCRIIVKVGWNICKQMQTIWKSSSSQVSSIDTALALDARGCELESRQYHCSRENSPQGGPETIA